MKHRNRIRLAMLAALAVPTLAFAHPGHDPGSGFALGLSHPFSGVDHIVLLVAAGLVVRKLGALASLPFLAGLLTLLVFGHGNWISPGAEGWGFVAGFLLASATLIGAGVGAVSVYHRMVTARARRSPTSPAAAIPVRPSTSSR